MARAVFLTLALALAPAMLIAQDNTMAPIGITPTTMSLPKLLHLHASAVGTLQAEIPKTRSETWLYKEGDLTGTRALLVSGKNYREDTTLGPFHFAEGSYQGQDWQQNANGLTHLMSGVHGRDAADRKALAHALQNHGDVQLLGQISSPAAYVVKVGPPNGRVEYVFYDKTTYLIVRTERAVAQARVITTYDDFRATDGLTEPWHEHTSNGRAGDDTDSQVQTLKNGIAVDSAKFAVPGDAANILTLSAPRVALPAAILSDRIILKTTIGGHKVDFQLDSGASGVLLDRSVAQALKIPIYGKLTEVTTGAYMVSRAVVPQIQIGGATMQNVMVETSPFDWYTSDGTPIAGLMGYDFVDTCIVHVDYLNGTVEAIAANAFTPPAGAVALPIRLDDQVPIIAARIGTAVGQNFILDTGADRSMIFSEFATSHPSDTIDQGLGEEMTDSLPFLQAITGVGGQIAVRPVQVNSLALGSVTFPRWLFDVTEDANAFNQEDYDGLIGQDVLRNFDLYLDYHHATVYLVPNARYKERWATSLR